MEQQNEVIMMLVLYLAGYFDFSQHVSDCSGHGSGILWEVKDAWDVSDTDLQSMDRKRDTFMCSGCSSGDFICAFVWKNCPDTDRDGMYPSNRSTSMSGCSYFRLLSCFLLCAGAAKGQRALLKAVRRWKRFMRSGGSCRQENTERSRLIEKRKELSESE